MTRSHSIAVAPALGYVKVAMFFLRLVRAALVVIAIGFLWLALFVLFLPFLLLSILWGIMTANNTDSAAHGVSSAREAPVAVAGPSDRSGDNLRLVFDRRNDISKLFGCNTRGVEYRWNIFAGRLDQLRREFEELSALDFGAGSLRDSYELAKQGLRVTSMDLNEGVLRRYFESYDWSVLPTQPKLFVGSFESLVEQTGPQSFHLALSFDVIEHLEDPSDYLHHLRRLLHDGGYLFTIIPNRRTILERYFKQNLKKQREKGATLEPGVPHLQFRSPEEWIQFLGANGFRTEEHDMAIGPLVNDLWNGVLALPIYVYVTPYLSILFSRLKLTIDPSIIERLVAPPWLMKRMDVLDSLLKKWCKGQFAWNLIVARKI